MNWTGGRLQRHSKSNANKVIKTQKEHFARTRVGRSKEATSLVHKGQRLTKLLEEDSLLIDGAVLTNTVDNTLRTHTGNNEDNDKRGLLQSIDSERVGVSYGSKTRHPSHLSTVHRNSAASAAHSPRQNKFTTASRRTNLFETARKDLLNQVDWLGISATKPPKIDLRSQQTFRRIGRHRKIKAEPQVKTRPTIDSFTDSYSSMHFESKRRKEREPRRAPSIIEEKVACHSSSRESQNTIPLSALNLPQFRSGSLSTSLIPKVNQSPVTTRCGSISFQKLSSSSRTGSTIRHRNEKKLLTLRDARDCASFDEVKARSSQYSSVQSVEQTKRDYSRSASSVTSEAADQEQSRIRNSAQENGLYESHIDSTGSDMGQNDEHSDKERPKLQVPAFPVRYEHQAVQAGTEFTHSETDSARTRFTIDQQLEHSQMSSHSSRFVLPSDSPLHLEDDAARPYAIRGCKTLGSSNYVSAQNIATPLDEAYNHQDGKCASAFIPDLGMVNAIDEESWSTPALSVVGNRNVLSPVLSFASKQAQDIASNEYFTIERPVDDMHDSWLKHIFAEDFDRVQMEFHAPSTPATYSKVIRPETNSVVRSNKIRTRKPLVNESWLSRPANLHDITDSVPSLHFSGARHAGQQNTWQDIGGPAEVPEHEKQPHRLYETKASAYGAVGTHHHDVMGAYQGPSIPQLQQRGSQQRKIEEPLSMKRKTTEHDCTWNEQRSIRSFSSADRWPLAQDNKDIDSVHPRKRLCMLYDIQEQSSNEKGHSTRFPSSPRQISVTNIVGFDSPSHQMNRTSPSHTPTLRATPIHSMLVPRYSLRNSRANGHHAQSKIRTSAFTPVNKAILQSDLRSSSSMLSMNNSSKITGGISAILTTPGIRRARHVL